MSASKKFKLVIAYDGTAYEGWQMQKTGTGVQEKVELALARLFPGAPRLHSSSRTDTGVHALGMVAHFEVAPAEFNMPVRKLALAINAWLPEDIRVMAASRARETFHARFDATGKQYRYFVWNHTAMNPLLRHRAWQVTRPLNLPAMRAAAPRLVGRHDFKSFAASRNYEMESTRAEAHAVRHQKIRPATDVHHRRRRFSLQNVPRHRRHAGADWFGQVSAGGNQADAGKERPAGGRHDGAGAWSGAVEGFLSKVQRPQSPSAPTLE